MNKNNKILLGLISIPILYFGILIVSKNLTDEPTQQLLTTALIAKVSSHTSAYPGEAAVGKV